MKIVSILLIALLVLGSYSTFNYAYAVDNNCMIIPIDIIQMPIPLGCIEQRLDALENATPSGSDTTICGNQGTGTLIHISGTNCDAKALKGSADISITNSSNTITIDYNGTVVSESTVCTSAGGTTLIKSSSGGNCDFKGLTATNGISITSNTNDNAIGNTGVISNSCSSGISCSGTNPSAITNTGVISNSCTGPISCSGTNPSTISCSSCITTAPLWERLCQNTLGSSATSLSCSSFTARKHLIVHIEVRLVTNAVTDGIQFNSDTGTNYAWRAAINGAADTTAVSTTVCQPVATSLPAVGQHIIDMIIYNNQAGDRKLGYSTVSTGADVSPATAGGHVESVCKWGNTSAQITTITLTRFAGTGSFDTGTEITVWGYN